ncbi:hypothetical protein CY34DRAFT_804121 [Suillus luteus UH-Slu-Lm8-n1]|uniref:Uncharacterized protein n=1 Tax=Suillus luteus UH-Slu-Lm8-n1 TaxID=930992 RepID=A0A0D0AMX5_9AGAM|nr:hypothetical protein CY34DRAFT_804121 [Suillus luteus UH-Slu-Lm8-n1]
MTHESNILMQSEDATNDNAPYLIHHSKKRYDTNSTRWQNRRTCTVRTDLEQKISALLPKSFTTPCHRMTHEQRYHSYLKW